MESIGNNKTFTNKPYPQKSRSNGSFSQAPVTKTDVGEFQAGYFVMADPPAQQHRPKTNKTPERYQRNDATRLPQQRDHYHHQHHSVPREGATHVRIATSPSRSPTRNKRSPHHSHPLSIPQNSTEYANVNTSTMSPPKPRKVYTEKHVESFSMDSGSPPKEKVPSPNTRWAGPAFSNAPPPSSLPLPDFPPFLPQPSSSPSSSPPQPGPTPLVPPAMYHESPYIQPPLYAPVYPYPTAVQFAYAELSVQPSLAQLSTDLRNMLHIGQPITQPISA